MGSRSKEDSQYFNCGTRRVREEIEEKNKAERRGIVAFKHEELELSEEHISANSQWKES